jgi:hypothetical protein
MTEEKRRYDIGGGWGNAVNWHSPKDNPGTRVVGWQSRIPRIGDYLVSKMQDGEDGCYRFTKVEPCGDPADMFFADVEGVAYAKDVPDLPERKVNIFDVFPAAQL